MNVLRCITAELNENIFGVLKVFPGAFRANIDSTVRVASPAVVISIEEVVRVHVGSILLAIETFTIEPILRLKSIGELTTAEVVKESEAEEEGESNALVKLMIHNYLRRWNTWAR
jgi:hypothetical protein